MLKCFFIKHSHSSEYRKQLGVCIFHGYFNIQNREARDRTPSLLTAKITYSTSGPTATLSSWFWLKHNPLQQYTCSLTSWNLPITLTNIISQCDKVQTLKHNLSCTNSLTKWHQLMPQG